ncbi:MAG: hypothetical protein HPAVJP_4790 [Candidatus Hepatoplasma vulgare]|nr:MAG: hypothetical protein HPAVJP_4790 [Candidatus Hepatoplasma sp.]
MNTTNFLMKNKIENKRTNVIDHKKYEKDLLIRIAITKDGNTILNSNLGRGIYFKIETLKNIRDLKTLKFYVNKKNGNFSQIEEEVKKIIAEGGDKNGK